MFSDPIVVKVDGGAQNHTRTKLSDGLGEFVWTDPGTGLPARTVTIKQSTTTKRFRREVRVSTAKVVADPINASNAEVGTSVYIVIDEPRYGFDDTTLINMVKDLSDFLTGSSAAATQRVLYGEY